MQADKVGTVHVFEEESSVDVPIILCTKSVIRLNLRLKHLIVLQRSSAAGKLRTYDTY